MGRRWKANSEFGPGPRQLLGGARRAEWIARLRAGRGPGRVTLAMEKLGMTMLLMQGSDGRLDPSRATLAAKAKISLSTVAASLARLRELGFVTWVRRLVRFGNAVEQTSNSYMLVIPEAESEIPTRVRPSIIQGVKRAAELSLEAMRAASYSQFVALGVPFPKEWMLDRRHDE